MAWLRPTLACFLILLTMQVAPAQSGTKTPPQVKPPDSLFDKNQFVEIQAGEFMMGSENVGEEPVHRVRISRGFEMGKYEVTQAQWKAVMENNPSHFKDDNLPVEQVSWEEVRQFIQK
jgi:formylglycine-generating enzyme required for sulfatase activity